MAIDPRADDLERLMTEDPGGPVVMLNLLRFAPDGQASYQEYARSTAPFLKRYGGEVLYAGQGSTALVAEAGQAWDAVLLVRYPSREAFIRMVADPEYRKVTALRRQALTEAVLQATEPWLSQSPAPDADPGNDPRA
ncbi:Uncharacterized conserved protein, DUF1330 family [Thermomonospora echinospora]|uniref:Uncharacterized conserved protein, DUF1330 family n=1 Tax=Thermomonospora echinospora TaxID=1992 RepID=A0A1H6CSF4_9ACTN|nr:DUF1330 domain-containing protein [Thermomonospora echinospora]SEG75583.1 Uncharacterized conserved protein, DUF1330 family [Thermomonospora echinospora]